MQIGVCCALILPRTCPRSASSYCPLGRHYGERSAQPNTHNAATPQLAADRHVSARHAAQARGRVRCRAAPAVKLMLHFDINETAMVGDSAGGDTFEDFLNKIICKNAFVRSANGTDPLAASSPSDLVWWDGTPLSSEVAPALLSAWEWPSGCVPFYKIENLKCEEAVHQALHRGRLPRPRLPPSLGGAGAGAACGCATRQSALPRWRPPLPATRLLPHAA